MLNIATTILTTPLYWVAALLLLSLFLRKRHRVQAIVAALVIIILFTNPFLHRIVTNWWEPNAIPAKEIAMAKPWQIGVVLGGFTRMSANPLDRIHLNHAADRFVQAVELYHQGKLETLVFVSGSTTPGKTQVSEATLAKEAAIRLGVPEKNIIALGQSQNTHENAVEFLEFLADLDEQPESLLLITSSSHMRRAVACFAKLDLKLDIFPTGHRTNRNPDHRDTFGSIFSPNPSTFAAWNTLFREWLAMIVYRLRGWV